MEYARRVYTTRDWEEQSIYLPKECVEDMKAAVKWAVDTGRNDLGVALAVMRALNKHGRLIRTMENPVESPK
jgi:hypothetical protein